MKHVSSISLGSSQQDFEFSTTFLGREMRVRRRGCDGSLAQALKWVKAADAGKPGERADALGLRLVKDSHHLGPRQALSQDATRLCSAALRGPVTTGARLGEIFQDWALRHAQATLGHYFDNANVLFFSGLAHDRLAMAMAEYSDNLLFADTLLQLGVPKLLTSLDALGLYASGAHHVSDWAPPRLIPGALMRQWIHFVLRRALQKATVVVADDDYLDIIQQQGLQSQLVYPNGFKRVNRLAFVIHPLSQEYFKVIKPVEMLSRVSPPLLMDSLEKVMAYAPPFVYSKVEGITSPNGVQAEGWLISVGGTPKEIMAHAPEFT